MRGQEQAAPGPVDRLSGTSCPRGPSWSGQADVWTGERLQFQKTQTDLRFPHGISFFGDIQAPIFLFKRFLSGSCVAAIVRFMLGVMGYAEKLQKLCVQKGLDQAVLAEAVGLSRSSISRILSGAQEPKLGVAWKLARLLGVPLDYLADEESDEEAERSGALVRVSEDEQTILKVVRRLGVEESMNRLLAVHAAGERGGENGSRRA